MCVFVCSLCPPFQANINTVAVRTAYARQNQSFYSFPAVKYSQRPWILTLHIYQSQRGNQSSSQVSVPRPEYNIHIKLSLSTGSHPWNFKICTEICAWPWISAWRGMTHWRFNDSSDRHNHRHHELLACTLSLTNSRCTWPSVPNVSGSGPPQTNGYNAESAEALRSILLAIFTCAFVYLGAAVTDANCFFVSFVQGYLEESE